MYNNGELDSIIADDQEWFQRYGVSTEDRLWYLERRKELLQKFEQRAALIKEYQIPLFDVDIVRENWPAKEVHVLVASKGTTGPFEKCPLMNLLGGSYSHQGAIPRPALCESVRQLRAAVLDGRLGPRDAPGITLLTLGKI